MARNASSGDENGAREAGISFRALAKRLMISAPGVGYAVERGEAIVQESHYELIQ